MAATKINSTISLLLGETCDKCQFGVVHQNKIYCHIGFRETKNVVPQEFTCVYWSKNIDDE